MSNEQKTWIHREQKEPDPKKYKYILVWGKECNSMPHVLFYSYDTWNHPEYCHINAYHSTGMPCDFDYWMECPEPP